MIKINLIPVKEKKKRKEFIFILGIVSVLVVVVLALAYIYAQRLSLANDLNKQIEDVKKESEGYQDKINEVKDLQKKEDSLEVYKKTIKGISETQRKIIVAVDQAALEMPSGVWLTNFTQGAGNDSNKFTIQGYAFSESDLQKFVASLQSPAGFLKEVNLEEKNVMAANGNNKQIHQFSINFKVMDQGT
jgi:Tfp pilus assembly protein PilN